MSAATIKGQLVCWDFGHGMQRWDFVTGCNVAGQRGVIHCEPHEITIDVPDINVVAAKVQALHEEKDRALAHYQEQVRSIQDQLSKLQAIEVQQ